MTNETNTRSATSACASCPGSCKRCDAQIDRCYLLQSPFGFYFFCDPLLSFLPDTREITAHAHRQRCIFVPRGSGCKATRLAILWVGYFKEASSQDHLQQQKRPILSEKWSLAILLRENNKLTPFFGVSCPTSRPVQVPNPQDLVSSISAHLPHGTTTSAREEKWSQSAWSVLVKWCMPP